MKKLLFPGFLLCLGTQVATAQLRTPQPSPGASVMQTFGVTDLTVRYSRPGLKGRNVWDEAGAVAPYGKLWRTGANGATALTTSTDLTVEGQKLAAGTYSIFSIPTASEWTLIFNKNVTANTAGYKPEEDALRVKIRTVPAPEKIENFLITFSDLTDSTASLNFSWADVKATAHLMAETSRLASRNVEKAVTEKPEDTNVLQAAAGYNLAKGRDLAQALAWTDKSIGLKETYRNDWLKAQILAKMGKTAEALLIAKKALALGESSGDEFFSFFKDAINKGITDYSALLPKATDSIKGKKKKA